MVSDREQNQLDILEYLDYCDKAKQNCRGTLKVRENQLEYLLKWVEKVPFPEAHKIRISFPTYLCNLNKPDSSERVLSTSTLHAMLNVSRMFFQWARSGYPERFENIQPIWIDSLRPPRHLNQQETIKEHLYYRLEDMMKIAALIPKTLIEKRGQAAMVFLYLSGMRVGAFLTLSIECVDLSQMKIYQVPSMGVSTKFHKAGITTLLNIPELLKIVWEWDKEVRMHFPHNQTWYAPIRRDRGSFGQFYITGGKASPYRSKELRREMQKLCNRAGVPFLSAHKLRHGHAVFGIKNAQNIKELKAVSQNLMHSSISITDGIYGKLAGDDFTETIARLGNPQATKPKENDLSNDLIRALIKLQANPTLLGKLLEE